MMRPTSPDPPAEPTDTQPADRSKVTDVALIVVMVEATVFFCLGPVGVALLFMEFVNLFFAFLLFRWVRFTLADAERAFRWAAVVAAASPFVVWLLGPMAGLLGGDSGDCAWFGLIGTYRAAALAAGIKQP